MNTEHRESLYPNSEPSDDMDHDEVVLRALAYQREQIATFVAEGRSPIVLFERDVWQRDERGEIRRSSRMKPFYANEVAPHSATRADLVSALRADPVIGPSIGKMVGSVVTGLITIDVDQLVHEIESGLMTTSGAVEVSPDRTQDLVQGIRDRISADHVELTMLLPLPGLQLEHAVTIAQDVELVQFTDEEIATCAEVGLLKPNYFVPTIRSSDHQGARVTLRVPNLVLDPATDTPSLLDQPHKFGELSVFNAKDIADDILTVLRLASPEYIAAAGHVVTSGDNGARLIQTRTTKPFLSHSYAVTKEMEQRLVASWAALSSTSAKKVPRIVLRRFNSASDRANLEDSIVDYAIAAEGLLLGDLGASDRTELSYRVSLRDSYLVAKSSTERPSTYRFIRAIYTARSRIAHGGELGSMVKVSGEGDVELSAFVDRVGETMRIMIANAISESQSSAIFGKAEYWDERILQ